MVFSRFLTIEVAPGLEPGVQVVADFAEGLLQEGLVTWK
jgi:hypothetical protein